MKRVQSNVQKLVVMVAPNHWLERGDGGGRKFEYGKVRVWDANVTASVVETQTSMYSANEAKRGT